jgi:hypothetical protein
MTDQEIMKLNMVSHDLRVIRRYAAGLVCDLQSRQDDKLVTEFEVDEAEVALLQALERVRLLREQIQSIPSVKVA